MKREKGIGKDTGGNAQPLKSLEATPVERKGRGRKGGWDGGNRFPAWLPRIHRAENLGPHLERRRGGDSRTGGRQRPTESEKGKTVGKRRKAKTSGRAGGRRDRQEYLLISLQSRDAAVVSCGRTREIQVEKAKVSSHDACVRRGATDHTRARISSPARSLARSRAGTHGAVCWSLNSSRPLVAKTVPFYWHAAAARTFHARFYIPRTTPACKLLKPPKFKEKRDPSTALKTRLQKWENIGWK